MSVLTATGGARRVRAHAVAVRPNKLHPATTEEGTDMITKYVVQSRGHAGVWRDSYAWDTKAEAFNDVHALLERIGTAAGEFRVVKRTEEVIES